MPEDFLNTTISLTESIGFLMSVQTALNLHWDHSLERLMSYFCDAIFKSCITCQVIDLILGPRLDFFCIITLQNSCKT